MPATLRTASIALAALVLGFATHAFLHPASILAAAQSRSSHDDPGGTLAFQLSGIGPTTALTVYNPSEHTLYVYPAVTQGASRLSCSFMLHLTRPGAPIDRENCAPGTNLP